MRQTVDWGRPSSRLALLVSFLGLCWQVIWKWFTASSGTCGHPVLFSLQMHISCGILLYKQYMFIQHGAGLLYHAWNELCTAAAKPTFANCISHNAISYWVAIWTLVPPDGGNVYKFQVSPLPSNLEKRMECTVAALSTIDDDMLQRVWDETDYRIDVCCVIWGAHIEHLLH
jgi:hypothetical protein